jgi:hypothetical protein
LSARLVVSVTYGGLVATGSPIELAPYSTISFLRLWTNATTSADLLAMLTGASIAHAATIANAIFEASAGLNV